MGKNSNCIGAMKFEEKLVTILGTQDLANAEARRIASDSFKQVFGDWENNKDAKWTDKQGALRQDDNGYPRLFKSGNQFYYKLKDGKKDFLNKIKFPEIDPDDVFEITNQLRYELFSTKEGFDFNNIENIKGLKIAESIQSSIDSFRAENIGDPDAQMRADLIEKYKDDFIVEVRTQIEDMGLTASKRIKAGARKDQVVDLTDENGNPESEMAEEEKSTGMNFAESFTKNSKDTASVNVKLLLSTVLDTKRELRRNPDGTPYINENGKNEMIISTVPGKFLGKPQFVEFDDVWTTLEPMLADIVNFNLGGDVQDVFDLMIERLEGLKLVKPWTEGLVDRLKELNASEKIGERNKITEFFQAFSKAQLTYYVTEVNGRNIKVINASSTNSRSSKLKAEWGRNFRKKFLTSKGKMNKAVDIEQISDMITESKNKFIGQVGTRGTLASKIKSISENLPILMGAMNALGVNVNNLDMRNFILQVSDPEKRYGEVKALYEGMERTMALIKDDKVPFINAGEFSNPFDNQSVLSRLANARGLSAIQLSENTIVGNEGKTYWTYSSLSYLHNKINSWKQQAGADDTMDIQALASLTYNKNSRWLKYLLASDVVNDSEREAESLKRIQEVEIGLSSSIKSKNKNDGVDNTKITIADAINDSIVKILGKKSSSQKSLFPTIVPADKSRKMDISGFEMFETGIVYTNGKGTEIDDATSDIFIDYFEDEYNRMAEAADQIANLPDSEKIEHYHTKSMNALKSQLFPEFSPAEASKEVKAILYDKNVPKKSTMSGLSNTQKEALRPFVVQAIKDRMKETLQELRKNKIIEVDPKEKGGLKALTIDKTLMASYESQSSPVHTMVGDYVVNGLISTIEYSKLFSGDTAYYKDQSDLIKRIPATYTDGLQLRLSENDHKFFNQATVNGVEVASKYLKEIRDSLTDKKLIEAYKKVNTTDAQAWITPHRWKFLKERLGQWGAQHEKVFKKMMEGKELDSKELKLAAQPLKGVYFEINEGRPVYLKYSQAVLVPSLVKNTPMQALYNKMTIDPATGEPYVNKKDELHEVITRDGVKVGAKGITTIHKADTSELLEDFELNSVPLSNSGWKLQQDLPTKLIHDTLTGSQIQKNILAGIDLSSKLANYELNGEPKTGKEIMQMIHDTIGSLVGEGKESLGTKFGIGEDNKITNMTAVYEALIDEFKSRGGDENIISALEKEMPFDAIPQLAGRVQSIFMSIFNKELIKVKTNGGSFIQVSPFGLESVQEIVKDDTGEGPTKVLRSGIKIVSDNYDGKGLKPPRIENGKVMRGQAMLPYSAIKSTIEKYNKQFKDENDPGRINPWNMSAAKLKEILDPSALEMVSYRIPNQGMSSNDALEIVGILPPELGDSIIAYDAVPGKTGSDFDIDKMYVMTHHLEVRDGKIQKVPSSMDSKKGKQNMLVDLYASVLTSPHTYDQMMTSIDASFLKNDIVGLFPPQGMGSLQFMSPIQQIKTKFEYLSGKFGVAQTANQLVDHASNQSLNIRLKGYLGIGHQDEKGRTKFDNIKDTNGKNTISDVLSAFLNAYVDIAKDPYISRGNHNSSTSNVTFMLLRAGAPVSWVNRFIGQPILKDLVDVINMSEGKTARRLTFGTSGKTVSPMEYIRLQYGIKKGDANEQDVASLSESKMEAAIKKDVALSTEEKIEQGRILDIFEFFQDHARSFNASVSAAKADTKGNGGGIVARQIAENKVNEVLAAKKIIGFTTKFKDTMMGHYYNSAVLWVGDVLEASDLFLVGKHQVLDAFNEVSESLGKGRLRDPELGRVLENSFRSYSMSGLSVFKDNNSDHHHLFKVLPEQISALKETSNNFLIQELRIETSGGYEFLGIDSRTATKSFNNRIYRAWSQLLNSSDPVERKLGVDLVRYAYSQSGFNNNLNQFFSHIPHNFFAEQGIAFEIDEMFRTIDNIVAGEDFKDQMLRHQWDNKTLGSKLVPELRADKVKGFGGLFSLGTGFISDEEKSSIAVEVDFNGNKTFPKFTKVMLNQKDVYDKGAIPNYGLFILRGEVNGNPVYTRTHKLGHKSSKGSIFEYNEKDAPTKSVVEGNNVPTKIKGEVRQIMSQLRSDPGFFENKAGISIQESAPSENVREVSTKILSNQDVAAFKKYVAAAQGKLPAEFFTSDSVFAEIKDSKTEGRGKMPQDHIWIKNSDDRYDMVNQTDGEIVIANVDLETGLKYEDVNIDKVSETKVSVVDRYSVADLKANPDKIYVFGDNMIEKGKGGQAIIRDEENAFGIPTKVGPSMKKESFFSDTTFKSSTAQIDKSIAKIKADGREVVFPKDGLGTGLAKLKEKAPQTFEYLNKRLKEEFGFDNTTGKVSTAQEERVLPGGSDYVAEELSVFHAKIAHLKSKMNVEVIMDANVPTSRVLGASDPRTIKAGKPVILINPKAVFKTTAIHEFAHIFIDAFPGGLKNKRLQKALTELKRTALYDEVKEGYPELSDEMFEKELLATAIGREGSEIWDSKEKEGMWTAFKNWFFDFLRRAFGLNQSEVTSLTRELLNNTVKSDLLANLSEQEQQQKNFGQEEKDVEEVKLDNTYNQIISSISNLRQAIEPRTKKELKVEESKKAGLDKGEKTKYQEVKALDEKLTEEMDKLNETANSRAILRYVAFSQKSVNEYKALVSRLTERGKLTPEEIKNIKFFTSVFNMIPDVKQLMLEQYEKGYLKNNNGQKKKRMAVLDKIIADYDTLNQEMLGVSRRIYAQTMVENSNEHVMAWRDKFERQYADLEARNATPDENIYEWVNAKMTANKDKIESEAFKFYEEQAKKSLSDIHASTGWLVSEKNIASAEIQTVSRMIDAADFEVDRWVQAQAKEVESAYEAFSKDYASSLGTEERYKKFVDQTDEGSYLISEYKAGFLAKYYEANSWMNKNVYEKKFAGIEVTKDGDYTINGQTKSLVLPRNGFKVEGTHVFYTEAGITHSMTLEEAIGKSERAYWIEENTESQKTQYGLDIKPKKYDAKGNELWVNKAYDELSVKDREHLKSMRKMILDAHVLTEGKQTLIEKAGVADFYRLPGVTRSSRARALSGDLKSLVSDSVTDMFKRKEDEFELEEAGTKAKDKEEKASVRRMADLTNKQKYDVPIPYRAKLSKTDQSLDIHTILLMNLKEAKNFEQKKALEAQVHVMIDVMSNRLIPNHSGLQKLAVMHGFSRDKEIQMHLPKEQLPEDVKTLISIMENRIYGIKNKDAGSVAGVNMQKATNTLLGYAGSVALIGNFVNSFVNATTGTVNNLIEAWGGETYNLTNWKNAGVKYWKDAKGLVGDMGSNTHSSKTNMMLDVFNVLGSRESLNNNFEDNSRLKSMLKTSKLRPIAQGGEHMMQSKVMYAVLDNIKILNAKGEYLDKNGNVTKDVAKAATLDEVMYFEKDKKGEAHMKLPKWVAATTFSPQPGKQDDILVDARGLIKKKIIDLHGNYDNDLKNKAQREWWGKLLFFLKKWMESTTLRRWRGAATMLKKSEELRDVDRYYSEDMKQYQEGFYVTAARFIRNSLIPAAKELKFEILTADYKNLSKHEKANMRRLVAELGMITMTILAYAAMGGFDDDPDDDTLMARYYLRREISELSFYLSPAETIKLMKNPTASISVIERYTKVLGQFLSPTERYEQGRNEGRLKLWVKTKKALPYWAQTEKDYKASLRFLQVMD
tara:strand:+ start:7515 stop:18467 length:10953 start_codon:yes stop_codon:yes gene_type:complete